MTEVVVEGSVQWVLSILLLGGLLFVGFFNIIVYLVRRRLKVHYYFGMLCVFYVIWYSARIITFDVYPLDALTAHQKVIIAAIATNRMALFLSLYTLHTLKITNDLFEKTLKIGSHVLLLACLFMPLSTDYTENLIWVIELFNVLIQVYFSYEIITFFRAIYKDIRIIPAICYFLITIATVMQFVGLEASGNTIFLAFFMMALQGIILSMHYNNSIIEVERANMTLERKVEERTAELVEKEQETIHLISSISHDLRTPISVVGGYMELLQSDQASFTEENKKFIANSLVRLSQMEKLTHDLFTLSQISDKNYTFTIEPISMTEIVEQFAVLYVDQAKEQGILLRIHTEEAICMADRMRILQVMDNLLINALTHAKTLITITLTRGEKEAQITCADDGEGIHPDDLTHVFDRFYKKDQQGTGLGLSNVKELIHRMTGEVDVESELHVGTRFHFTLPLATK